MIDKGDAAVGCMGEEQALPNGKLDGVIPTDPPSVDLDGLLLEPTSKLTATRRGRRAFSGTGQMKLREEVQDRHCVSGDQGEHRRTGLLANRQPSCWMVREDGMAQGGLDPKRGQRGQ